MRGLENAGNTCFLNSTVQALSSIPAMHSWCSSLLESLTLTIGQHQRDPIGVIDDADAHSEDAEEWDDDDGGAESRFETLARVLALLRALCWPTAPGVSAGAQAVIVPSLPLDMMPRHIREHPTAQHDAHELLVGFIQALEERLAVVPLQKSAAHVRRADMSRLPPASAVGIGDARAWARSRVVASSVVLSRAISSGLSLPSSLAVLCDNPFSTLVARRKVCIPCRQLGRRGGDPPWTIVPESVLTLQPARSLSSCVHSFLANELIHGYECDDCMYTNSVQPHSQAPNAIAETRIVRCPTILALHITRLIGLDDPNGGVFKFDQTFSLPCSSGREDYELMAVVAHRAFNRAATAGHYVAYRRVPVLFDSSGVSQSAEWVYTSDRTVIHATFEGHVAVDPGAYLLLFQRVTARTAELGKKEGDVLCRNRLVAACRHSEIPDGNWLPCQSASEGENRSFTRWLATPCGDMVGMGASTSVLSDRALLWFPPVMSRNRPT